MNKQKKAQLKNSKTELNNQKAGKFSGFDQNLETENYGILDTQQSNNTDQRLQISTQNTIQRGSGGNRVFKVAQTANNVEKVKTRIFLGMTQSRNRIRRKKRQQMKEEKQNRLRSIQAQQNLQFGSFAENENSDQMSQSRNSHSNKSSHFKNTNQLMLQKMALRNKTYDPNVVRTKSKKRNKNRKNYSPSPPRSQSTQKKYLGDQNFQLMQAAPIQYSYSSKNVRGRGNNFQRSSRDESDDTENQFSFDVDIRSPVKSKISRFSTNSRRNRQGESATVRSKNDSFSPQLNPSSFNSNNISSFNTGLQGDEGGLDSQNFIPSIGFIESPQQVQVKPETSKSRKRKRKNIFTIEEDDESGSGGSIDKENFQMSRNRDLDQELHEEVSDDLSEEN